MDQLAMQFTIDNNHFAYKKHKYGLTSPDFATSNLNMFVSTF